MKSDTIEIEMDSYLKQIHNLLRNSEDMVKILNFKLFQ